MLSILIADDHHLVRDTVAHYLDTQPDVSVRVADSLDAALAVILSFGPFDIVLLDVMMPGMQGITGVDRAIDASAGGAVVLFSGAVRRGFVEQAHARGARGYIPKTLPARALIHALRYVAAGRVFLPLDFMSQEVSIESSVLQHLTPQEARVLDQLCEGRSNKEIAREMILSEVTIKTYMRSICAKLGARNRTHAAMIARGAASA